MGHRYSTPLGRFFTRHGQRFHSIAWYVDEGMAELFDTLRAAGFDCRGTAGVRLTGDYVEGPVFTNPADTLTQLEFIPSPNAPGGPTLLNDPRYAPGWSPSWWADYHPMQIHEGTVVTDPQTTHGCVMSFTTWAVPDDPRSDWTAVVEGPVPASLFSPPP
jgi:hypothetical protein